MSGALRQLEDCDGAYETIDFDLAERFVSKRDQTSMYRGSSINQHKLEITSP